MLKKVEVKIQEEIIEEIRKDRTTQELAKQLNKLADSIPKNSCMHAM